MLKDITRHDATNITEPNLNGKKNGTLIMTADIVGHPHNRNRLDDVAAYSDEEHRHIMNAGAQTLTEQDDIPDRREDDAERNESITVLYPMRKI